MTTSDIIRCMDKVGRSLKQVLDIYGISQNKLAVTRGLDCTVVYR